MQGNAGFAVAEMDDPNVVVGKRAVDVGNDFVLGHFLEIRLNISKMQ
jgi:hypothetical protein